MKRIKMLEDYFPYILLKTDGTKERKFRYEKGKEYLMTENDAKSFLKERIRFNFEGKVECYTLAIVVEDFGLHFGTSKHVYKKNGLSKVFG